MKLTSRKTFLNLKKLLRSSSSDRLEKISNFFDDPSFTVLTLKQYQKVVPETQEVATKKLLRVFDHLSL